MSFPKDKPLLREHLNHTFIETGTGAGDGVRSALDAGFEEIISIDINDKACNNAATRFRDNRNVTILLGDSRDLVPVVLRGIRWPVTFWLDAHWMGPGLGCSFSESPLLVELEAIRKHPIPYHTILVDDVRLFGDHSFGMPDRCEVASALKSVSNANVMGAADGYRLADILVSKPEARSIKEFVCSLSERSNIRTVVELGAKNGEDTEWLCKRFHRASYFACEPDPRNIQAFSSKRLPVRLVTSAVSDRSGEADFWLCDGAPPLKTNGWPARGSSSLLRPKEHLARTPWVTFPLRTTVKTITLDELAEQHAIAHVDFLWCDIQGSELAMIHGGKKTLAHTDYLLLEFATRELYEGQGTLEDCISALPGEWHEILREPRDEPSEWNILLGRRGA